MSSFILIHPTAWPQHANVTDRQDRQTGQAGQTDKQTDRQGSDSIGRTVLQTFAQKSVMLSSESTGVYLVILATTHKLDQEGCAITGNHRATRGTCTERKTSLQLMYR